MTGPVIEPSVPATVVNRYLGLPHLLLLNAVVCGVEFCASAAFTYIPPLLLKAGLEEAHMSFILGIGPLLGFFFVPVIGRASDSCQSKYGRRRPFILGLGLMLILSLVIIPFSENLVTTYFGNGSFTKSFSVVLLIVGSVLLDFTSQACLTPCEALLSDTCKNTNQQDRCFMVYSFMVSIGGCIGYLVTALDWNSNGLGQYFGGQEQAAFSLLIILFSITLCATLLVAAEKININSSPDVTIKKGNGSEKGEKTNTSSQLVESPAINATLPLSQDPGYESDSNPSLNDEYQLQASSNSSNLQENTALSNPLDTEKNFIPPKNITRERRSYSIFRLILRKQCHIPLTRWTFTSCDGLVHLISMKLYTLLPRTLKSLMNIPFVLKRLALANFCSWTAVMGFNLFFTDFVGQAVYGGNPNAPQDSPERALYDEGVRMGSWGLLFHCITSAVYATFMERLVAKYGLRWMYFLGMFSFTLSMAAMMFAKGIFMVNLMAACTGFGYGTLTTIPFMLVSQYHEDRDTYFYDSIPQGGFVVGEGVGSDMATLDTAYFLSQVVLSLLMGYVVAITGTVLSYVVCACATGAVACACSVRIIFDKKQILQNIRHPSVHNL